MEIALTHMAHQVGDPVHGDLHAAGRAAQCRRQERLLGETGINVITRLLGILLAALAVQFVLDGLTESLPGLAG